MLDLASVRFAAAVTLVATLVILAAGLAGRPRPSGRARVVAVRAPSAWTEVVWFVGVAGAILWPAGFLLMPEYAYHWPSTPDFPGSSEVQLFGMFLALFGAVLFSIAARMLGAQLTPAIRVQEGHRLVVSGPYRLVRHPIYTAVLLVALGQTLLFLSPLSFVLLLLVTGVAEYRARLEESLLRSPEAFGAAYDGYAARTGRFVPRLRGKS